MQESSISAILESYPLRHIWDGGGLWRVVGFSKLWSSCSDLWDRRYIDNEAVNEVLRKKQVDPRFPNKCYHHVQTRDIRKLQVHRSTLLLKRERANRPEVEDQW